jgi:hypothetical protein
MLLSPRQAGPLSDIPDDPDRDTAKSEVSLRLLATLTSTEKEKENHIDSRIQ